MDAVPALVTLHVWQVPALGVPRAVARLAADRLALSRTRGLSFAKGLGTGGDGFGATDATPARWALLTCWRTVGEARAFTSSPLVRRWARASEQAARLDLRPLASRGTWSRREPFGNPVPRAADDGPVVALTRARLRPRRAGDFWRAVEPVAMTARQSDGLCLAFGVGEAPVGFQGTVSVWESAAALKDFAYGSAEHAEVVRRTPHEGWYAEELFARFALVGATGRIGGTSMAGLLA